MLLSALTLAAMLQAAPMAAPMATSVAVPQAAPAVGLKGYLLQRKPFNTADQVDQLRMPLAKRAHRMSPEAALALAARRSATPRQSKLAPPRRPLNFVRGPQMANCENHGLERAGHPEAPQAQPLSKMPRAHGERAVARLVDGCPVAVLIAQRAP